MARFVFRSVACLAAVLLGAAGSQVSATWSIVIADSETKEVAVGTVTCLEPFDLLAIVPVVVVGKGSGACQAAGDFGGSRRPVIFNGLMNGDSPDDILADLALIGGHQQRQYGIADTLGRTLTFTGTSTMPWTGGITGSDGSMVYAIQGNVLTGSCVVPAIEAALLNTVGDMPEKLMAGMQAAKMQGGDGRCSCSPAAPEGCGCPPVGFVKPGHIGGMIVARIGDTDDALCSQTGCADGDYFMRLNVAFQTATDPEPVGQLQMQFDTFRTAHVGRPDAIHSTVAFQPDFLIPAPQFTSTMKIQLKDWQDAAITAPIQSVTVMHAADSDNLSTIGAVSNLGGGMYSVTLTAGTTTGTDRFVVTVDDGVRPVILMPEPMIETTLPAPATSYGGMVLLAGMLFAVSAGIVLKRRVSSNTH